MGYVILLRLLMLFGRELFAVRGRRLYSIAQLSVYEANRKMWAPWVVVIVFALVLAFTHWFLQPPRAAEMGRLFVATLTLLCSLLLTAMVTILVPLSLPNDIQQQTIHTVVSKPVRRLELIWGRMIGFMALVTVLIVVFGGISLAYLWRTVGTTIKNTEAAAVKAKKENRTRDAVQLVEQADQLRSRMAARVPVKGSLSFLDSRGTPHAMGIDVGMEQSMKEPRSHIEGSTPATAIWSFGIVPDPFSPANRPVLINRKVPVQDFLPADTVEGLLNRSIELQFQLAADERAKSQPNLPASDIAKLEASIAPTARWPSGSGPSTRHSASGPTTWRRRRPRPRRAAMPTRLKPSATSPAPARRSDHRGDDVQRLQDHQGQDRRAGTGRDAGDQSTYRRRLREHFSDQGIL